MYPITFSRFIADTDPVSIQAHMRFDEQAGVDVATSLILEYPDGLTATLYCSFQGRGGAHALITGDQGRLVVPAPYHPGAESSFDVVIGSDESRSETFQTGTPPFQPAIDFFQQCLRGEETPAYMADHADGTLRVVEAALNRPAVGDGWSCRKDFRGTGSSVGCDSSRLPTVRCRVILKRNNPVR